MTVHRTMWFPKICAAALMTAVLAQLWSSGSLWALPESAPRKANYVGSARCRSCHMAEHKGWSDSPHARSMGTLAHGDPKKIEEMAARLKIRLTASPDKTEACVTCHVTGFQLRGGYPQPDSIKNAGVASVGCESCHGPGSLHLTAAMADKKKTIHAGSEAMCRQCHTAVLSPDFDFAQYSKRGVHPLKSAAN
jgi:hypothetical protein